MYKNIKAMAVDDNEVSLMIIRSMSQGIGLSVKCFMDPIRAAAYAKRNKLDIAFIDYLMPEVNGIQLIEMIRKTHPEIPIVMITGEDDFANLKLDAMEAGATEYMYKPLNTFEFGARVKNLLNLRKYQILYQDKAHLLQREIDEKVRDIVDREFETLSVLGRAAEYKDTETSNHVKRVASYARLLAEKLGKNAIFQETIFHAAPLHDVGKIGIPDHILTKPGRLTKEEFEVMKQHPEIGYCILKNSKSPYLQAGGLIARSHHEKYDGSGYPYGLSGNQIPLMGRIISLVDVFDALTSKRPYKKAWPFNLALKEIKDCNGTHFDPKIVNAFFQNLVGIKAIKEQFHD
ncbi:MAG: two-component system response regulator [Acidobacteria bacterium]|nr:MAG: two-component system response regulator [Acidobacteriota bacterium]